MLTAMFCHIDDFCNRFEPAFEALQLHTGRQRRRPTQLALSEMMTLVVYYHHSHFRTFKHFYTGLAQPLLKRFFPQMPSYNRFVELMPRLIVPLCAYLSQRKGSCTGIAFIDATPLRLCHNRRIRQHRVFDGVAQRGKCSLGYFFGFKLHLVVNDQGELLGVRLTPGNVDDREYPLTLIIGSRCAIYARISSAS